MDEDHVPNAEFNFMQWGTRSESTQDLPQIWGSSLRVQVENIFMKELEEERRHSWSDSSDLDN
jgi:hypothetical protein